MATMAEMQANSQSMDYTGFTKSINTLADLFKQSIGLQKNLLESFDTSAIARHSASPLEKSLNTIKESSVSFNEKTLRWHDDQTNRMVKGTDPRVVAQKAMGEKKSDGDGDNDSDNDSLLEKLTAIEEHTKNTSESLYGDRQVSAEEAMEEEAYQENRDKDVAKAAKERENTLGGIWESIKKGNKENWFVKHWKKIALGLFVLFAPLKWLAKIWEFVKDVWEFFKDNPVVASISALTLYFTGGAFIKALGSIILKKGLEKGAQALTATKGGVKNFLQNRKAQSMMTPEQTKMSASRAANAAKVGPRVGKSVPKPKGIFGKIVEKFGKAGKWIKQLGSKFIMPLFTNPYGWAILGGLALGGLAYAYWDEVKAAWNKITASVSETFSKVSEITSSLVGDARTMLGDFLRSVGAGMIADWIDPDGADPEKEKEEFTWGGFAKELWNIYSGIWQNIFKTVKGLASKIGNLGLAALKAVGAPEWLINMLGGGKEEEVIPEGDGAQPEKKESGLVKQAKDVAGKVGGAAYDVSKALIGKPLGKAASSIKRFFGGGSKENEQTPQEMKEEEEAWESLDGQPQLELKGGADLSALLGDTKGAKSMGFDKEEAGGPFAEITSEGQMEVFTPEQQKILYDAHLVKTEGSRDYSQMTSGYNSQTDRMWQTKSATGDLVASNTDGAQMSVQQMVQPGQEGYKGPLEIVPGGNERRMKSDWISSIGGGEQTAKRLPPTVKTPPREDFKTPLVNTLKDSSPSKLETTIAKIKDKFSWIPGLGPDKAEAAEIKKAIHITPLISPDAKTAGLNNIHSENAQLKDQQGSAATMVNAPVSSSVTNNSGSNIILASNTAQGGMDLSNVM